MAIKQFNSVAGFSVGDTQVTVIDANANISASFLTATGNVSANALVVTNSGNITGANVVIATTVLADNIGNAASILRGDGANISGIPTQQSVIDLFSNGSYTGNFVTTAGNIITGTGNISGGNIATGGIIAATGNVSGGNLTTVGVVAATGNVSGGNVTTAGEVAATGNVSGGNLTTGGEVVATGNVAGGNLTTGGVVAATGNVSGGNITTGGQVVATGNLVSSANVNGVDFNASGIVAATGNVSGGNLTTGGQVAATGNVSGGNLTTGGEVVATGNIDGGNVTTGGVVAATGNVSGGNLTTGGQVVATGNLVSSANVNGVDFNASGIVAATGNVSGGNVTTGGQVVATGNVAGGNITTSGQVAATGNVSGGNLTTGGAVEATGNVSGGNVTTGGQVVATGNISGGNINTTGTVDAGTVLATTIGNASSTLFGDGANLSSITGANVTGQVANALVAGTVYTNAQPNITSVGTLANLTVNGPTDLGAIGNVTITGGTNGQVLTTDGLGVLSFSTPVFYGNSNVAGFLASGNDTSNIITTANVQGDYIIGNGSALGSITGANVTGEVAFANTANLVSGSNIAGNVTASAGNFFIGNGSYLSGMYGDSNVASYLPTYTGNLDSLTGNVITTANVSAATVLTSNVSGTDLTFTGVGVDQVITLVPTGAGNVNVSGKPVTNLATPTQPSDAATKAYVDGIANGLQLKAASNAATTGTILATLGQTYVYTNGASGVGATITFDNTGVVVIDGVTLTAGMRVLIKDEPLNAPTDGTTPSAAYNGIYDVTTAGAVGTALVLTRSTDDDVAAEMYSAYTFIFAGTVNQGSGFASTDTPTGSGNPIIVGTSFYDWVLFSQAVDYTGGNAIQVNGTVINALYDSSTIGINGSNQLHIPANAPLTTPNIGAATGTSLSMSSSLTASAVTANTSVTVGTTTITTSVTPTSSVSTVTIYTGTVGMGYELLIKGFDTVSGDVLVSKVLTTPDSDYIVYGTVISGAAPGTFGVSAGVGGVVTVQVTPASTNAMFWTVQAYGV